MTENETTSDVCPCKVTDEDYFMPLNSCKPRMNYCNWPCRYQDCDVYKRHTRITDQMKDAYNRAVQAAHQIEGELENG